MSLRTPLVAVALAAAGLAAGVARADRDADLAAVNAAVATRSARKIDLAYSAPFPALAPDPASPALGNASWALAALWLDADVAAANARLVEIRDAALPDVYWAMGQVIRIEMLFGCDGVRAPGRLTPEAEEAVKDLLLDHVEQHSRLADASDPSAWTIEGSENHDVMRRSVNLLATGVLARDPARADRPMPDGFTLAEHHAAWSSYFVRWLQERARRGTFVERGSPTYSKYTLQSVLNLRDFAPSQDVRDLAGKLLDLAFMDAAHELFDGVRGGAKSRSYHDGASARGASDSIRQYVHLLAGSPASLPGTGHPSGLIPATSTYRMPRVVLDVALHPQDRGRYAYVSRGPARGTRTVGPPPASELLYHPEFPQDFLRTTVASPAWIAGAHAVDPSAPYMAINSQNRWFGVIFPGSPDSRVHAQCVALESGGRTAYDEMTGLAEGDAMVVQRLARTSGGPMRVFFSNDLVREEAGGWVFAREAAGSGWLAVRPGRGGWTWDPPEPAFPTGTWMRLDDQDAPVIFQMGVAEDFAGDFAAFRARVVANPPDWPSATEMRYAPATGREIGWPTNGGLPTLDGVAIDLNPGKTYSSPFIDWDADALAGTLVATSGYGARTRRLDFGVPSVEPARVVLEAESGAVAAPMLVADDVAASGRAFVHVPDTPGNSGGDIRFSFATTADAEWTTWARILAVDGGSNSFTESVDGEPPAVLGNGPAAGAWEWVRGATRGLTAGPHELVIGNREDGSRIDQVVLLADGDDAAPSTVARDPVDSDGDGVPDAWLQRRFGHAVGLAADASRAGDDADGDGETTLEEFRAGTNPRDAADALVLRVVKRAGDHAALFTGRSPDGAECPQRPRLHAVMGSSGAATGPWSVVAGLGALPGSGAELESPLPPGGALEFYEVLAAAP